MKKIFSVLALSLLMFACDSEKMEAIGDDCKGEVQKDKACTMEYDPVCGCDGKTYGNACDATVNGIKKYTAGACDGK